MYRTSAVAGKADLHPAEHRVLTARSAAILSGGALGRLLDIGNARGEGQATDNRSLVHTGKIA